MDVTPIECLPDEILLEIFNYFDGISLKNIMFVRKRWHEIISKSASTMKKLPINLRKLQNDYNGETFFHNYHTLIINRHIEDISESESLFELYFGSSLQQLSVSYCSLNYNFFRILKHLKQLKYLTMTKVKLEKNLDLENFCEENKSIQLQNLKLIHIDYSIVKYLMNIQVIEFEIISAINDNNVSYLIKFCAQQKTLSSLEIEELNNVNSIFMTDELTKVDFRLKKFKALFCTNLAKHANFNENLISFLRNHSKSLESFQISGSSLSSNAHKFVISNIQNLNSLEINPNSIPQDKEFYDNLNTNTNLKILKINSTITKNNFYGFSLLLARCPNIEILFLTDTDDLIPNDLFSLISDKLRHLVSLLVLNFSKNFIPWYEIKTLKTFSIKILNDIEQFLKFISLHGKIECIKIDWIKRDFDHKVIEEIISLPNLTRLTFGGRFNANKRIYETVANNYKKLRILELIISNYDEIKNLKFIFPINKSDYIQTPCLYFLEQSDKEPLND